MTELYLFLRQSFYTWMITFKPKLFAVIACICDTAIFHESTSFYIRHKILAGECRQMVKGGNDDPLL